MGGQSSTTTMTDIMIENELRQTEIQATVVAKMAAVHQKQMNKLMLKIIQDDGDDDDDDSSTDSLSSSDTSTTADSTVEEDEDNDDAELYCNNNNEQTSDDEHHNVDENNQEPSNRKKRIILSDDENNFSGSSPPTKRHRPQIMLLLDHNRVYNQLQEDYLGEKPVYPKDYFQKRYGISLERFRYILEEVSKQNHPFYKVEKSRNSTEPCIEAKLLLPLGALISGSSPDRTIDYFQMSEEMALECCDKFDEILHGTFGAEYLRTPLPTDLENIRKRHKAAGPGVENLFCTREGRLELWKECPVAWRANLEDVSSNSPIVLKGASDNQHWIWHVEFGLEDTANNNNNNNKNNLRSLSQSPLPQGIDVVGKSGGRRGIKRAFYLLQSKFQFLQRMVFGNTTSCLSLDQVGNRIRTCILLHNMIISDKVMGVGDVRARYDPNFQLLL